MVLVAKSGVLEKGSKWQARVLIRCNGYSYVLRLFACSDNGRVQARTCAIDDLAESDGVYRLSGINFLVALPRRALSRVGSPPLRFCYLARPRVREENVSDAYHTTRPNI